MIFFVSFKSLQWDLKITVSKIVFCSLLFFLPPLIRVRRMFFNIFIVVAELLVSSVSMVVRIRMCLCPKNQLTCSGPSSTCHFASLLRGYL